MLNLDSRKGFLQSDTVNRNRKKNRRHVCQAQRNGAVVTWALAFDLVWVYRLGESYSSIVPIPRAAPSLPIMSNWYRPNTNFAFRQFRQKEMKKLFLPYCRPITHRKPSDTPTLSLQVHPSENLKVPYYRRWDFHVLFYYKATKAAKNVVQLWKQLITTHIYVSSQGKWHNERHIPQN